LCIVYVSVLALLKLILFHNSDLAEVVFNKCTTVSDHPPDSHDFEITLNYEFLEDIYADWVDTVGDDVSIASDFQPLNDPDNASLSSADERNAEYNSIDTKTKDKMLRELESNENHPLMLMVSNACIKTSKLCKYLKQKL